MNDPRVDTGRRVVLDDPARLGAGSPGGSRASKLKIRILQAVFFLSGFTALCYQVAWQRVLTQAIGVDALSTTLIVAIFMLGLGLGGLLGSALVRRAKDLIPLYVWAELVLGLFGFFSVSILRWANSLVPAWGGLVGDFAANFAALALPTVIMGLTLPLIVHTVRNRYSAGHAIGVMYSANAVGAAAGALAAGFVLIGVLGLARTCQWMGFLNLLLAGVVWALVRSENALPGSNEQEAEPGITDALTARSWWLFAAISLLSGFIALSYEIVFFRVFTAYFGAVSYVFPLLLCAYLVNMAIGNSGFGKACERGAASEISAWIGVLTAATTILILLGPALMLWAGFNQQTLEFDRYVTRGFWLQAGRTFGISTLLMLPVLFVSGIFPVLVHAVTRSRSALGMNVGRIYFIQTLGNTLGALVTGLVLLPGLGTVGTLRLLGLGLALIPLLFSACGPAIRQPARRSIAAALFTVVGLVSAYPSSFYHYVRDYYDANRFNLGAPLAPAKVIENAAGVTLAYPIPDGYWVNVGRMRTTYFPTRARAYETWPMEFVRALRGDAGRALVIGIGPGVHLPILQRMYPGIQIDVLELNGALIDLMLGEGAPDLVGSMRASRLIVNDGRRFVMRTHGRRYDIIQLGVNHAAESGAGNLFSREFIQRLRELLAPDGVLTLNAYAPVVKAVGDVFKNVMVVSPGDGSRGGEIAAAQGAQGSGARVSHVVAWNNDDPQGFHKRLLVPSRWGPSIIAADPAGAAVPVRPNWDAGCLIPGDVALPLLADVHAATDDLPVTEYFLTQREVARSAREDGDSRYWGCPPGAIRLQGLARARPPAGAHGAH